MKLVENLLQELTDSRTPLSDILRKCKILANNFRNPDFEFWINSELNGYHQDQELPDYRKIPIHAKGTFINFAYKTTTIIPPSCLEDEYKEWATLAEITESVDSIEDMVRSDNHEFGVPWPGDLIAILQRKQILEGYTIISGWKVIPRGNFLGILAIIRTKILDFILELNEQIPEFKDLDLLSSLNETQVEKATQIYMNHFPNFSGNLAIGSNDFTQKIETKIVKGDFSQLKEQLIKLGLNEEVIRDLEKAIKDDGEVGESKTFGRKVTEWIGKVLSEVGSATLKIGVSIISELITNLLKSYYGI